jgi:murein DD-endopeptidase MepM/ murein hydrolase activator NlpD
MVAAYVLLVQMLAAVVFTPQEGGESAGWPGFAWPVEGKVVDDDDGKRNPAGSRGVDILVPEGTEVQASLAGTVIYAGSGLERFGKLVLIRHEGDWVTVYGHNSELFVNRGEEVQAGHVIARSGRSGHVARPELYFEIRMKESPLNPAFYLPLLKLQEPESP